MKLAIITGASKGIGEATGHIFQPNGYTVLNISRSESDFKDFRTDLSENFKINSEIQGLLKKADQICLIHNAAIFTSDSIQTIKQEQLKKMLEVSIKAPIKLNQQILPYMKKGSSIIYIGSTLSQKAVPNTASYVITKHAVVGLMKSTCQDLAGSNIHTACICPGFTDTEMLRSHIPSEEILNSIKENITYNRLINPKEIASLIFYSSQNPVINGSVLHANLGQKEK